MRTVSFSQPEVCQLLDSNFVCFHTSTEGDPTAGQSIRHAPGEPAGTCIRGNGPQNLQTLFLTPKGEIFHVISGFVSPEDLYEELGFAAKLFEELKNDSGNSANAPASIVVDSHRIRLANFGFAPDQSGSVFDSIIGRQVLADNQFCMRYPLMSSEEFERDPTPLVGNGKSFFMSNSSGN